MTHLDTSIIIYAPAETVWRLLTDFPAHAAWNPFIRSIAGEPVVGSRLTVRIEPPGRRPMTFHPTVTVVDPPRELRWVGRLLVPGLFTSEHVFTIEPIAPDRCRFAQSETFSGPAAALFARTSGFEATGQGFAAMSRALQRRAETLPPAAAPA